MRINGQRIGNAVRFRFFWGGGAYCDAIIAL